MAMSDIETAIMYCALVVCTVAIILITVKHKNTIKCYEKHIAEQERIIESLNRQVSRLNKKVKENKLITTMEDLRNEQIGFEGDNRVYK